MIRRLIYTAMFAFGGGAAIGLFLFRVVQRLALTALAFKNFKTELNTIELRFRNQGYTDIFLDAQN